MDNNLPNFYFIGAAKSGTTSVYKALAQHPQVFLTNPKSPNYFLDKRKFARGFDWYLGRYYKGAEGFSVRGESTPSYLVNAELVAPRMRETFPEASLRFLVVLRNPVDRAYSHYWYNVARKGIEKMDFAQALAQEEQRAAKIGGFKSDEARFSKTQLYFQNGLYAQNLQIYFKYFSRDQFLILLSEDLSKGSFNQTIATMCEFLTIDRIAPAFKRWNQYRELRPNSSLRKLRQMIKAIPLLERVISPRRFKNLRYRYFESISNSGQYPEMPANVRHELVDRYRDDVLALQEIVNRDLSSWLLTT